MKKIPTLEFPKEEVLETATCLEEAWGWGVSQNLIIWIGFGGIEKD